MAEQEKSISSEELLGLISNAGLSVTALRQLAADCSGDCSQGCSKECSNRCISCYNGGSTGGIVQVDPGALAILEDIIARLKTRAPRI